MSLVRRLAPWERPWPALGLTKNVGVDCDSLSLSAALFELALPE